MLLEMDWRVLAGRGNGWVSEVSSPVEMKSSEPLMVEDTIGQFILLVLLLPLFIP